MASKKGSTKKKGSSKKNKQAQQLKALITLLVIVLVIVLVAYFVFDVNLVELAFNYINGGEPSHTHAPSPSPTYTFTDGDTEELQIHFLELGNKYTGDCTLIKVGDTEVLIDAGSRKNSAVAIKEYVDKFCTDGVLEYVIATHAHQDHIAGFVGSKQGDTRTGILYQYDIEVLIQFALTNSTSVIYGDFKDAVEYAESQGTEVYTALECWNETDGAKKSYALDEEGEITLNILYNYFYENKTSDENDYSVCTLITQGSNNYLLTGDLEKEGEEKLVENNDLPKCKLFKAGHHGSYTASNDALLSEIQPEIVCVCCCCGSDEYTDNIDNMFPAQAFVERVLKYTDKIYVTSVVADNDAGYTSMNGYIVVKSTGGEVVVQCSNNDTIFTDTEWYKNNRVA
ncbi:MAG: MBL fold metallo-hydrolase [Clostridia bacterium]|nr:MBL fold metallo-hydrolase [Clostridia bacterium]